MDGQEQGASEPQHGDAAYARLERVERAFEMPVTIAALLYVVILAVESKPGLPEGLSKLLLALEWAIWALFCAEIAAILAVAPSRSEAIRRRWFDFSIAIISIPLLGSLGFLRAARGLRVLRLLRAVRALSGLSRSLQGVGRIAQRHGFHYVAAAAVVIILGGSSVVWMVEGPHNPAFASYGNTVWWAIATATTVGYGDLCPATVGGRIVAVIYMFLGIGIFSVATAMLASYIIRAEEKAELDELRKELVEIKEQLARLGRP